MRVQNLNLDYSRSVSVGEDGCRHPHVILSMSLVLFEWECEADQAQQLFAAKVPLRVISEKAKTPPQFLWFEEARRVIREDRICSLSKGTACMVSTVERSFRHDHSH